MTAAHQVMQTVKGWEKYQLIRAARPFSLTVALMSCLQGIMLGWAQSAQPILLSLLILAGGILLQFGVNLINDHSDLKTLDQRFSGLTASQKSWLQQAIIRNYRLGLVCFAIAGCIGLWLIQLRGLPLLALCLTGLAGAYYYTQEPVNYKCRGLGVPLVFLLMGVMMIGGASYVMTGSYGLHTLYLSLPLSLLTALLLLSNELRDYESDQQVGQTTLTVRMGYDLACELYKGMVYLSFILVALLAWQGLVPSPWWLLLSLPALRQPFALLQQPAEQRKALTPLTGRFHTVFGALLLLASFDII